LDQAQTACIAAAAAGQQVLLAGGSALDAVETAVRLLEDCPVLDAGRGSYPNSAGQIEMDALIMDGADLAIGAVAAVQLLPHPISLARLIMREEQFNFLVGEGAEQYADAAGLPRCAIEDLLPPQELDAQNASGITSDTVGAVALDQFGNLASATSTGGTEDKHPGRIGDSPLAGSGGYADNRSAAVSATGRGEHLMKLVVSKQVCDFVSAGLPAQEACQATIDLLAQRTGGTGGLIAIDNHGRVGIAYSTAAMPYGYAVGEQEVISGH
jgi:beta-aspartyl-peptidase (threonine type)